MGKSGGQKWCAKVAGKSGGQNWWVKAVGKSGEQKRWVKVADKKKKGGQEVLPYPFVFWRCAKDLPRDLSKHFQCFLESSSVAFFGFGESFEPIGDFIKAFVASFASHSWIHVGVFVGFASDGGF